MKSALPSKSVAQRYIYSAIFFHIRFVKTACGDCRSSDSDTACYKRLFGVVGDGVLVGGDVNLVKSVLKFLARYVKRAKVKK